MKPATPLPWDIRFTQTKAQAAADSNYQGPAAFTGKKDDVKYAIRAANYHAKLVAALLEVTLHYSAVRQAYPGSGVNEVEQNARALLRELGEL